MNEAIIALAVKALMDTASPGAFNGEDLSEILYNALEEVLILKWDVSDVFSLGHGLTHEQAVTTLNVARDEYDPDFGITFGRICQVAREVRAMDKPHAETTNIAKSQIQRRSLLVLMSLILDDLSDYTAVKFTAPNHSVDGECGYAVFFNSMSRGVVAFGDKPEVFTECSDIKDLLDRYLNLDGKTMVDAPIRTCADMTITI